MWARREGHQQKPASKDENYQHCLIQKLLCSDSRRWCEVESKLTPAGSMAAIVPYTVICQHPHHTSSHYQAGRNTLRVLSSGPLRPVKPKEFLKVGNVRMLAFRSAMCRLSAPL